MSVCLLIPTIDEIEGMKVIMPRIKREWVDEILFVDGGSTDGTIEYCKEHGYPLFVQKERGGRFAYNEAVARIKSDYIVIFSPDGNSVPEVIPMLVEKAKEGYDMVIASRYLAGAKSEDDGLLTWFGNRSFTTIINFIYGSKYTDAMVMYRIWKKQMYYDLELHKSECYEKEERMFRTIVGVEPLMSIRAAKRKLKVAEIPGDEPARIGGVPKLQPFKWGACYLYEVIREMFVWR